MTRVTLTDASGCVLTIDTGDNIRYFLTEYMLASNITATHLQPNTYAPMGESHGVLTNEEAEAFISWWVLGCEGDDPTPTHAWLKIAQ